MNINQTLETIPLILKKTLSSSVCYFDGELQEFNLDKQGELALVKTNKTAKKVIIVARDYYSEQALDYPIDNTKELKKLLKLESNNTKNAYYHIWGNSNGKSLVNKWQFNKEVPEALIRLPISLLLALTIEDNQVLHSRGEKDFYLARTNKLIHSLPHSAVINSSKRFAISAGVAQSKPDKQINETNLLSELAFGFKNTLPLILSFIQIPKVENRLQLLKNITLPVLVILIGYFSLTSGYLIFKHNTLEKQLANQGNEVAIALEQQVKFDEQFNQYQGLKSFLSNQQVTAQVWLVLVELFPQVQFTNVSLVNTRFILRGKTDEATKLLERLSNNDLVSDAKFDFPTRKNRGKESFVISFELLNEKLIAQNHININKGSNK